MYPNCHRIKSQKNVYTRQGNALVSTIKTSPALKGRNTGSSAPSGLDKKPSLSHGVAWAIPLRRVAAKTPHPFPPFPLPWSKTHKGSAHLSHSKSIRKNRADFSARFASLLPAQRGISALPDLHLARLRRITRRPPRHWPSALGKRQKAKGKKDKERKLKGRRASVSGRARASRR